MTAAPPDRPRVAYVSGHASFYGGGQRSLYEMVVHLAGAPRGVDPLVVLPGPGPLGDAFAAAGVPWIEVPLPPVIRWAWPPTGRTFARFLAELRRRRIDLLHSDAPRSACWAGAAARLSGRRHVWHLRASRSSSSLSDRLLLGVCDRAVAVSRAAAARSRPLRRSGKVRVVPTGVAPIAFLTRQEARAALGLAAAPFVVGVVGRVEEDKGSVEAIAAFARLRRAVPGALLIFLGPEDRDGRYALTCRVRASGAGLSDAVVFAGERPEGARLLPAFDLLLHASRHEALPRALIEGLLGGVPIVARQVGGVAEVFEDGRSGVLVDSSEPSVLGDAAASLALDAPRRARLSAAGIERARAAFSLEAMGRRILDVYGELAGAPRARGARAAPAPAASRRGAR